MFICRTRGRAGNSYRPYSGGAAPSTTATASPHCKKATKASDATAARYNETAATKTAATSSAQGTRAVHKHGCFEPPWTSMRRKAGSALELPSDWGWVALNPCKVESHPWTNAADSSNGDYKCLARPLSQTSMHVDNRKRKKPCSGSLVIGGQIS